jgi:hypothetical protein
VITVTALTLAALAALTGCGSHGNQPTAQERDLGPTSTRILGGTADSRYLHVFSASISTALPDQPRFDATLLYVGTGSDRLVRVRTPLGNATVTQSLDADSAVPVSVPLHGSAASARSGSTVSVSIQLADHPGVTLHVPIVGPTTSSPSP